MSRTKLARAACKTFVQTNVTRAYRLFSLVHVLDPFGVTGKRPAAFKVLDNIDPSGLDDEARALVAGLIFRIAAVEPRDRRNLATLREYLALNPEAFSELLMSMQASTAASGLMARAAKRHLGKCGGEAADVLAAARRHTSFLDRSSLSAVLDRPDFRLVDLKRRNAPVSVLLPPTSPRYAAIVLDARTGRMLYSSRADAPRYPASLTKMMTVYMLFAALQDGTISDDTPIPVSQNAASSRPMKLNLEAGASIDVDAAIKALCVKSANDVATAVAEFLGGTEQQFAAMMTERARQIGMRDTTFRNASGLPDPGQVTTARDIALLGMALRARYPARYYYFSLPGIAFNGETIEARNSMLKRVPGADGIKTGFTTQSGYNLASSVIDDGRSIVAVVMGEDSASRCDDLMEMLIARFIPEATRG